MKTHIYRQLFILTFFCTSYLGQQYTHNGLNVNVGIGTLIGHLDRINHLPKKNSTIVNVSYIKYSPFEPNFGIGFNYISSGNKQNIGNIYGLYGFTKLRLSKLDSTFKFKIGFGTGYVEHIFDPSKNNKNIAIGSHLNANVVFFIEKEFLLNNNALYLGAGITHFSNGSFQTPNLGLNFLSLNLGYSIYSRKKEPIAPKLRDTVNNKKWSLGLEYTAGIRENFEHFRKKYGLHTFRTYFIYNKRVKRDYIGGVDLIYNPSVQYYNSTTSPIQLGLFLGKKWKLNQLELGIDMGIYTFDEYKKNGLAYQRLVIGYYITDKIKSSFALKSHWTIAQAFQLGIAYELK